MSDFPTTARVVIIGGGVVGVSTLYHLAKAGWSHCVLLEKNELTAGSTWHAAGNCPSFSTSWAVMNMQRYSLGLYADLADEVDYPMNYHVTGSIRLAHDKNRMLEFERARTMGRYQGLDIEMMSVSDMKDAYPFLETHDLGACGIQMTGILILHSSLKPWPKARVGWVQELSVFALLRVLRRSVMNGLYTLIRVIFVVKK